MAASLPQTKCDWLGAVRVLHYLSSNGPEFEDRIVAMLRSVEDMCKKESPVDAHVLLASLLKEGLVERMQFAQGSASPYAVTREGRHALVEAQRRSLEFKPDERIGWVDEMLLSDRHELIANFVRDLPEFKSSSEIRVTEVANQLYRLAEALKKIGTRPE